MGREHIDSTYALVTGGSTGLGKAISKEFAARGHNVLIVSLPNTGQAECISEIKNAYSVEVLSYEADLSQVEDIRNLVAWVKENDLTIQALVNNAGLGFADSFDQLSFGFISTLLDVNIKATVLLTHELIPILNQNKSAYILNVSSAAAFYVMPYKSIYAASKKFIMDFSMALREELREQNIHVTAICPAGITTSEEIKLRIEQAGLVSRASALQPEQVAKSSIKAMLNKKAYHVPGRLARIISFSRYVVPPILQRKMLASSYKKRI